MSDETLDRQYQDGILQALLANGGSASAAAVRKWIELNTNLVAETEKRSSSRTAFKRYLYSGRSFLLQVGLLEPPRQRGVWELSSRAVEQGPRVLDDVGQALGYDLPLLFRRTHFSDANIDIERAALYLQRRELRIGEPFPFELAHRLIRSSEAQSWKAGLYLVGLLAKAEIAQRFFAEECIHSISRLLATDFLSAGLPRQRGAAFTTAADHYFKTVWNATEEVADAAKREAQRVHALQSLADEANSIELSVDENRVAIIVHGTFAATESWWRPGGDFWSFVKGHWSHLYGGTTPFVWSGANSHSARLAAADDLVNWVKKTKATRIDVIAHSHGGNVCLLAARAGLKIDRLILLGTPIRTEYMIDLTNIHRAKNVFSTADKVQTPLGSFPSTRFEGRTLGDCSQVSNWRAYANGRGGKPDHGELHSREAWIASDLIGLFN